MIGDASVELQLELVLPERPERTNSRRRVRPDSVSSIDSEALTGPAELLAECSCAGLTGAKLDLLVRFLLENSNDPLDCRAYLNAFLGAFAELTFVAFQNAVLVGKTRSFYCTYEMVVNQ